jgi:hypothetical protein
MTVRTKTKAKAVSLKAGEDMQVHVKDLLPGRLTVGQKEVNPFTSYPGLANRSGQSHAYREEVATQRPIEVGQMTGMGFGHNQ